MVEYHKSSPGVSPYRATHCKRSAFIHVRRMGSSDPVLVFPCPRSNAPVSRRGKGGRRFVVLHHEELALAPPARQPRRDNGLQCSLIGGLGAGSPDTGLPCSPAFSPSCPPTSQAGYFQKKKDGSNSDLTISVPPRKPASIKPIFSKSIAQTGQQFFLSRPVIAKPKIPGNGHSPSVKGRRHKKQRCR